MPLHFQDKFPTFVGDILNYGSVTLFSYGYGVGLLLILSIGFPTACRTKIKLQPCAFFIY